MNITEFALEIGIPRTTINHWLNQKMRPQVDSICIIAKYFKVTSEYLLGLED